jgi:hypothetical protein
MKKKATLTRLIKSTSTVSYFTGLPISEHVSRIDRATSMPATLFAVQISKIRPDRTTTGERRLDLLDFRSTQMPLRQTDCPHRRRALTTPVTPRSA